MSFRKKDKSYNHTIMIKRSIEVTDELREWIFKNSNYRRKVWNDFVAEYYRCRDNGEKFDVMKYKSWYFHNVETPNHEYDTHCVGISAQVMKDVIKGLKITKTNHGKLKFRRFDRFKCSFTVYCKPIYRESIIGLPPKFNSRVYFTDDQIMFRSHGFGDTKYIKLKELLFHDTVDLDGKYYFFDKNHYYAFSQEDVKSISFIHELGKFYVLLAVNVIGMYSRKHEIHKRKNAAGIDLGIHNPVCISDDEDIYIARMEDRVLKRIHYLERRARRLQSIMDKKQYMSKNYTKVLRKFRVTLYKIVDLRKDWRRKLSKRIALAYKKICVDTYEIPGIEEHIGVPKEVVRKLNAFNRLHGMYLFSMSLQHACWKYHTKYIDSPSNTTRTCSKCGYINPHLSLSQRVFQCERCNYTTDRDINAAQNCYAFIA